ncbi:DJ-1/PfpI family protein [Conexibacter sp. SYSU D00693]|uniref:DJ-1/PfpI family protein n=1 Tax=Conexibacter sp. SYSU D00693 TaxID=2812560 RepID=UPI00196AF6E7|nr:DJ-1/PfpI family protein [Conexibacter sp. SYSU D00693]
MQVAIPLFEDFTALDAIGPYEVLSRVPGTTVRFLAHEPGPVRTDNRMLQVIAEAAFEDVPAPDVVCVPGGISTTRFAQDERLVTWVRGAHETSTWTTSVCTGAIVLGAAGVLDGLHATTHWLDRDELASHGAVVVEDRVVFQGKVVTAAGVSSGIDMALALVARMCGDLVAQAIQLGIEYDPQPPFDAGALGKAPAEAEALVRAAVAAREEAAAARAAAG